MFNNSPYNKMNRYYSNIPLNYIKNNQRYKENSNIYDEKDVYHSLNFADDKNICYFLNFLQNLCGSSFVF